MTGLYYCTNKNNTCTKKDECKRYLKTKEDECVTTLFKSSCTEENNYLLFVPVEKDKEEK